MAFDILVSSVTHSRSALRSCLLASSAPAPATTTSADFSLRQSRRPFRRKARSPQVRTHTFIAQPPHLRRQSLGHKSFVVHCPLALLGSAFYAVLVHRLAIYASRFLPTFGRPHAVALHFTHCDQLVAGLAPAGVRPCWAHNENAQGADGAWAWMPEIQALTWPMLASSLCRASLSSLSMGRTMKSEMRRLSTMKLSLNARRMTSSLPFAAAGSSTPQWADIG